MDQCIPNIGPAGRRRRLVFGAVSFAFSVIVAAALVLADAHLVVRALVAIPLYGAALGFFQYREKT